jgi:transposase
MLAMWTQEMCPFGAMMDTYTQAVTPKRRYLALEQKRRIVEETLAEGVSVARIALAHGVNANLVFNWRRLYQKGLLCDRGAAKLLPVQVTAESLSAGSASRDAACNAGFSSAGTIHIQLRNARVRVEGSVDSGLVRVVLECLGR